jgi:predicted enzyme related to lactoylglutathione lyase
MNGRDSAPAQKPRIIAPVSRHLVVADVRRSVAFYRDVMGFDVSAKQDETGALAVAAVTSGPARIQLGSDGGSADDREKRPAILFFETGDVAAMRAAVAARGGNPSGLENVNWIKKRVFEIRDPDGNTLWIGQSLEEPEAPKTRTMLHTVLPELPLDDVAAGIAHYRDVLGFQINYAQHDLGVMDRDRVRILLIARTQRHQGIGSCYAYVHDADALHAELRASGANVLDEPVSQPWGLREFHVLDLEGNRITFGQPFE